MMGAVLEYAQRHAVSGQEYLRMGEAGVFAPDARLELIEGEIVEMAPIGSRHAGTVKLLNRHFSRWVGDRAVVSVQDPLIVGERSVPQPDVVLLKPRADSYSNAHPTAADVLLVVEVADTTLEYDSNTKVPLYARSGIREVWLVNLRDHVVDLFREPTAEGYAKVTRVERDQRIASLAFPDLVLNVEELFR